MNILLLGSGGREHALAWKLAQSPSLTKLYAAPGNPGIAEEAECVALDVTDQVLVVPGNLWIVAGAAKHRSYSAIARGSKIPPPDPQPASFLCR